MLIAPRSQGTYAAIPCDATPNGRIPLGFPVLPSKSLQAARRYQHIFVLCSALHLREASKFVSEINREHRLQALFVRSDVDAALLPQMLDRAGLRFVRNIIVHSNSSLPRRVMTAWLRNSQAELIASATVAGDRLILMSCEPRTYEIRFDQLPSLKCIAPPQRRDFRVAEDGSFIWWPAPDVHLDLDAVRAVIDPSRRKKAEHFRREYGRQYGAAIAAVRKDHGLRQTDIPGLSERQLRRIEESGAVSVRAIEYLAKAHGMSTTDYLDALARTLSPTPRSDRNKTGEGDENMAADSAAISNCSIEPTDKDLSYWITQPYLDDTTRREVASADLLLIPQESFGDQTGPLFPVGTEEFLAFLKGRSELSGYGVDIGISDAAYRELALHGETLIISEMLVKLAVLPVAIKLIADYIRQHLWSSRESRKVKTAITVDMADAGKNQTVKIIYDGPADDFASAMRSATEALEKLKGNKES